MGVAAMLAIHCPAFTKRPPNAWGIFVEEISNIGALIIRIGFEGIIYHDYNKEPPK